MDVITPIHSEGVINLQRQAISKARDVAPKSLGADGQIAQAELKGW